MDHRRRELARDRRAENGRRPNPSADARQTRSPGTLAVCPFPAAIAHDPITLGNYRDNLTVRRRLDIVQASSRRDAAMNDATENVSREGLTLTRIEAAHGRVQ